MYVVSHTFQAIKPKVVVTPELERVRSNTISLPDTCFSFSEVHNGGTLSLQEQKDSSVVCPPTPPSPLSPVSPFSSLFPPLYLLPPVYLLPLLYILPPLYILLSLSHFVLGRWTCHHLTVPLALPLSSWHGGSAAMAAQNQREVLFTFRSQQMSLTSWSGRKGLKSSRRLRCGYCWRSEV